LPAEGAGKLSAKGNHRLRAVHLGKVQWIFDKIRERPNQQVLPIGAKVNIAPFRGAKIQLGVNSLPRDCTDENSVLRFIDHLVAAASLHSDPQDSVRTPEYA
jgi:hypothetical protein